jgi:glycosyltransferase involved in cell wall biosynthesis
VLYISKALTVAAYRDKLRSLAERVDVSAVMPARWGGHDVEPLTTGGPRIRAWPVRAHGHNHFHTYRNAARMLRSPRPDLVHIDEEPYSAVTSQLAWLCTRGGTPFVFFAWQNLRKRLPPPFGALRSYVFRHAAGAIAGTDAAGDVLRAGGWSGPVAVIPQLGVDPGRFRPDPAAYAALHRRLAVTDDEVFIGYGGRLVREKGVDLLVRAVAGVPGTRLIILGDGPERAALERQAEVLGVAERVAFAGHIPSLEVPRWLAALDLLVLPTVGRRGWVEQFGRILIEAMACGVPVIGSRSGEIPRVVGEAGVLIAERDERALTEAISMLAARPDLRAGLGARGRARVLDRFTNDRIAGDTVAFYRTVTSGVRA